MRGIWFGLIIFLSTSGISEAQQVINASQDSIQPIRPAVRPPLVKKPKPIRTEFSGGIRLNTNGWSLFAEKGWVRSAGAKEGDLFYNLRMAQIEFSEIKHPKEIKQTNDEQQGLQPGEPVRPFILGKVNNFYSLKFSYGFRKMIAGKPEPGNVSVHWFLMGGPVVGLLKPYYVDALVPIGGGMGRRDVIKYSDSNARSFLNERLVMGSAGFSKGLNEIKLVPGLQFRTGLHFDFAPGKKTVLAINLGVNAELYTKKIEIMARQNHYPYNVNLFAGFQFGKRW